MIATPVLEQLDALDAKVQAAVAEVERLRAVNRELHRKVGELERRLAATTAGDDGGAAWRGERDEVRQRVESLVGKLESLLEA